MKIYKVKNYKGNLVESLKKFSDSHKGMKIVEACEDGDDLKIKAEASSPSISLKKEKFFHVICDYDENKNKSSACDLAGTEFYVQCKLNDLPKVLAEVVADTYKKYDWNHPDQIKFSLGKKVESGVWKIESYTDGKKWKPQILLASEENLYR